MTRKTGPDKAYLLIHSVIYSSNGTAQLLCYCTSNHKRNPLSRTKYFVAFFFNHKYNFKFKSRMSHGKKFFFFFFFFSYLIRSSPEDIPIIGSDGDLRKIYVYQSRMTGRLQIFTSVRLRIVSVSTDVMSLLFVFWPVYFLASDQTGVCWRQL